LIAEKGARHAVSMINNQHKGVAQMNRMTAKGVVRSVLGAAPSMMILTIAGVAHADGALPKQGSISIHSGYYAVGESVNVAEKQAQGHGTNRGISFNDNGSGPLHRGPTDCFYTFSAVKEPTRAKGYCTFGDADGDRIFTEFSGAFNSEGYVQGSHTVDGGTGKYAGIQGTMSFKCKYAGGNGEIEWTQRLDYRLP
jgi:hypothetical protein